MFIAPAPSFSRRRAAVLIVASMILNLLPAQQLSAYGSPTQGIAAPFVRLINLPVNDVAYDKLSKKLFVSVPSRAGAGGNAVTEIDPVTGAIGTSVFVGSEPNKLAISDDGQALYVGLDGAGQVRRVDVATHSAGTQFRINANQDTGTAFVAGDMAVVPGNPNAVAVARRQPGLSPPGTGVAIYENGLQRPNIALPIQGPTSIAFGATASTLYGLTGNLEKMTVDASGVSSAGSPLSFTYFGELQFENGFIYDSRGKVFNTTNNTLVGTFPNVGSEGGPFVVDAAAGRAFYAINAQTHGNNPLILRAYDINTFGVIGELAIGGVVGTPTSLVRWGANGLAFRTNVNQLFLVQTALIPSAEPVPDPTPTPAATPTPTPVPIDVSVRHIPLITKDLVYVPSSQAIFASIPSVAGPSGNTVASIDPANGTVGSPVFVGSEPTKLALADDGHTLYVGLNGSSSVRRFDAATQTPGLQFSLGTWPGNQFSDGFFSAADLAPVPGSPGSVAVDRITSDINPTTSLSVYDDGVKRPNDSNGIGREIEFSSLPTRIYSSPQFGFGVQRNVVSAAGVSFESSSGGGNGGSINYAGGLIYTANGSVFNPETGELKGTFTIGDTGSNPVLMTVDLALGRAYFFIIPSGGRGRLSVFDLNTFLPMGETPIEYKVDTSGVLPFEYSSLVRWGQNGLAFRTSSHVTIIQTALIGPGPFPAATPTPSPTPSPSPTPQLPTFVRQIDLPARDVIYNASTQKLYASISGSAGPTRGDSITSIDPATGALGTSVSTGTGTEPDKLALSDNGQVLWLGYNGINTPRGPGAIRRFDIATQTLGPDISLGTEPNFGAQQFAYDIAVAPGDQDLIAVARYFTGSPPQTGVAIYKNSVKLPNSTPGHLQGSVSVAFGATAATLYGGSTETGLKTIAVDSNGATITSNGPYTFGPAIDFKNGLLYSGQGKVVNPTTGQLLGTFKTSVTGRAMAIDPALNRVFFATGSSTLTGNVTITAYDLTTFVPVGRVTLPLVGVPSRLVRWGVNGLAVGAVDNSSPNNSRLYILQSALVSTAAPIPTGVSLSTATLSVSETVPSITFNVVRTGDLSVTSTVKYATADGSASERSDYLTAIGTLTFAPGETNKTIRVFLTNDAYQEANETFALTLSDPSGAIVTSPASGTVTIQDDDFGPQQSNPVDSASFFVRQHYLDFLNRTPDASGLNFWVNEITSCGSDIQCVEIKRINVSAAFFLSIEFQETGYLVYKANQAAFNSGERLEFRDFLSDTQELGRGVIIGQPGALAQLEVNKQKFFLDFVKRPGFLAPGAFPTTLPAADFVDQLNGTTFDPLNPGLGPSLTQQERDALVAQLSADPASPTLRAQVLRSISENRVFTTRHSNKAFVLMQYFGYLRRKPNDPPEQGLNFDGYNFWLGKLNQFNGNFVNAEMVRAFIISDEYRKRFAP